MILVHKIELDVNNKQRTYLKKAAGVARFAFNWALSEWNKMYEENKKIEEENINAVLEGREEDVKELNKISEDLLRKKLNAIKRKEFPWMIEVSKWIPQNAIRNLGRAFDNYFDRKNKLKEKGIFKGKSFGYPKFKKKGKHDSFQLNDYEIIGNKIRIPKLNMKIKYDKETGKIKQKKRKGRFIDLSLIRMKEKLRFKGRLLGAVIIREANKWFVSIRVEMNNPKPNINDKNHVIGVDLGIKDFIVLSDGTKIDGSKPYKKFLDKIRRLNKLLSRKEGAKKGEEKSKNFLKVKEKLSRLHVKVANIRKDSINKITTELVKNNIVIGIENLNISGMVKNRKISRALSDMGFYEFKRQLKYKAKIAGGGVIEAGRNFLSSKMCSKCGYINKDLELRMREWECQECNKHHDRDINAAINLRIYAYNVVEKYIQDRIKKRKEEEMKRLGIIIMN